MSLLSLFRRSGGLASPGSPAAPGSAFRYRAAFLAVLAVVVVGVSLKYAAKIQKPGNGGEQTRSAFLRWRGIIHDLYSGANVYEGAYEYPNPPIMAVVLKPFADLPPFVGAMTWFYAKVLMAVLAAVWVFRLVGRGDKETRRQGDKEIGRVTPSGPDLRISPSPMKDAAKALAILLSLSPLLGDLSHNNVNIFILFLVAACLEAYRRGWDVASGLVLALAIACKVTPLMFVAYFAWKRSWRVLAGCAVGLVLWLAVVPGTAYGWQRNGELLEGWYKLMVRPSLVENRVTSEHPNQSLPGAVYRLFTHSPSFIEYDTTPQGDIPRAAAFHNVADIGTANARLVVQGAMLLFGLAVVALCRARERQGPRFAAECALIVLGMLLFSERTWKHHAVTLLLPFAVLTATLFATETTRRARSLLVAVLVMGGFLTLLPGMLRSHTADLAMVYGSYTVAFVVLTIGVCWLMASRAMTPPPTPPRPGGGGMTSPPSRPGKGPGS
jgi:hypothetical protein